MSTQNASWKVGLLILVFGGMAYGVWLLYGSRMARAATYDLRADFANIGGLTKGAKVMMAGVEVGSVVEIRLTTPKNARALLRIRREFQVPEGSVAQLPGSMFLPADQRVDIVTPAHYTAYMTAASRPMKGILGKSLDSILPEGEKTLIALQETLQSVRKLIDDKDMKGQMKAILANAEVTSGQIKLLAMRLNRFASDNEHLLAQVLKDVAGATTDMKRAVAAATELITDPQWKSRAETLLDSIQATMDRAQVVVESVRDLVNDPALRANLNATMTNMEAMTASGTQIANTGKEIADNVKTLTVKANVLADEAGEIAEEAKSLLNRLNTLLEGASLKGPKIKVPQVTLDFQRNIEQDLFRTDINLAYPLTDDARIYAGVYDATEANKLNLQYSTRSLKNVWTRYGLYAAKPGLGVDFSPSHRVTLQADLFDPNDATFNVRSRFRLGTNWGAYVGFDRLFRDTSLVLGISLER